MARCRSALLQLGGAEHDFPQIGIAWRKLPASFVRRQEPAQAAGRRIAELPAGRRLRVAGPNGLLGGVGHGLVDRGGIHEQDGAILFPKQVLQHPHARRKG